MKPNQNQPVVFISYAHTGEQQAAWVSALADKIRTHRQKELPSVKVIFDQDNGYLGANLYGRMRASIAAADVILLILTPDYKEKADHNIGSVGYEYNLIRHELFRKVEPRKKCIPLLKQGSLEESMPADLYHLIGIDMSSPEKLEGGLLSLIRSIVNPELINAPMVTSPVYTDAGKPSSVQGSRQLTGTTMLFSMIAGSALIAAVRALEQGSNRPAENHPPARPIPHPDAAARPPDNDPADTPGHEHQVTGHHDGPFDIGNPLENTGWHPYDQSFDDFFTDDLS